MGDSQREKWSKDQDEFKREVENHFKNLLIEEGIYLMFVTIMQRLFMLAIALFYTVALINLENSYKSETVYFIFCSSKAYWIVLPKVFSCPR